MSAVWDIIICDPKGKLKLDLNQIVEFGGKKFQILGSQEVGNAVEYYGEEQSDE